jgi:hypothetical protein
LTLSSSTSSQSRPDDGRTSTISLSDFIDIAYQRKQVTGNNKKNASPTGQSTTDISKSVWTKSASSSSPSVENAPKSFAEILVRLYLQTCI